MVKSAKEIALEAQMAQAQAGQESAVYNAQVEVYEGQTTTARDAYSEAKSKRSTARAKLPEEIPDDKAFQERLLESQYAKNRASRPSDLSQVDNYVTGIKSQQQAKKTIKSLDEQIPLLLSSAEKEVATTNKQITSARDKEIINQSSIMTGFRDQIFTEQTRVHNESVQTEKNRVAKYTDDFNKAEALRVSVFNKAEDVRVNTLRLADNKLVASALSFVKADQKRVAIQLVETKRLADVAKEKERIKQEVITKNAEFFASGKRFYDSQHTVHYATFAGIPIDHKSEVKYYDGGRFTQAYYERAGKARGITTEEAFKVSQAGRISGSGKARDQVLRSFQDPTGASEALYQEHRRLAAKTTASAYGAIAVKKAQASGTNTATDIYGSKSLVGTNVKAPKGNYTQQIQNAMRQQRTVDLRAGNVGLATALLEPVTAQKYTNTGTGESAISLTRKFLVERGYKLDNLDAVPNSVFKIPVKYTEARKQSSGTPMGDLTTLIPKSETMSPIGKVGETMVGGTKNEYFAPIPNAELVKRQEARARLDKFKVIEENYNMLKTATAGTITPAPKGKTITVPTMSGTSFTATAPVKLEKKPFDTFGFDPISNQVNKDMNQSWTVTVQKDGAEYTSDFKTKVEANLFVKEQNKQANVFSGTDNKMWNAFNKANAIDSGELPMPTTPMGKLEYYANVTNRPVITMGASIANLFQPEDKQIPVREVASGKLIGGTISDVIKLDPLKGSGVKSAYEYAKADPLRTALELPAEALMWIAGGKAIQLGAKGAGVAVETAGNVGTIVLASNAPRIIKIPTMIAMQTGKAVGQTGKAISVIPNKIGSKVYDYGTIPRGMKYGTQVFTAPQQVVRQGIVKPYNKFTVFEGDRVGFKAKADFIMTPSGRLFVRQSKEIGTDVMSKPQFLNRQVAMFESEGITGFATRGKMRTVQVEMPTAKSFDFKAPVPLKEKVTSYNPFDRVSSTRIGKPDLDMTYTRIGKPDFTVSASNPFDRIRHMVFNKPPKPKTVKTSIDEVTFYSDTFGGLGKKFKPTKIHVDGELNNYQMFNKPEITSSRSTLQNFKTSTSVPVVGKDNLRSLFKKKPMEKHTDKIATGADIKGAKNLELVQGEKGLVEKGIVEEVGKKTVFKGSDYFAGGKKMNLKQNLETSDGTYSINKFTGKATPNDETTIYNVTSKITPVDKVAFSSTMKNSMLLKKMKVRKDGINDIVKIPPTPRPNAKVPTGVDPSQPPVGNYHAFMGESKSIGGTFQGTRVSLGEGAGKTGTYHNTGTPRPPTSYLPVNKFTGTNINAGTGGGSSTPLKALSDKSATSKFTETKVELGKTPTKEFTKDEISTLLNKKTLTGSSGSFSKPKFDDTNKIPDGYKAVGESGSQTLVKLDIKSVIKVKPQFTTTKINLGTGKVIEKPKVIQTPAQIQVPRIKAGVKPPKTIHTPAQIQVPRIKAGVKPPIVSPIVGQVIKGKSKIKPKIDHEFESGLIGGVKQQQELSTETSLGHKQQFKTRTKQITRQIPQLKLSSGTMQQQKYAVMNKPPPLKTPILRRKTKPIIVFEFGEPITKVSKRGKRGKKAGFIGNVRLDNITGMYKRKEITYGARKVTKLERQDARLTSGTSNRMSTPSSGLLTSKKKKKKKDSVFGGKDEFAGFESKSKGKKKGKKKSKLF